MHFMKTRYIIDSIGIALQVMSPFVASKYIGDDRLFWLYGIGLFVIGGLLRVLWGRKKQRKAKQPFPGKAR